ncbi:beta-1,6-N-acetylglucosaminyltransferase [Vibrio breoganii]|uniref:beta-1,6-N-acetylglucosaminyltransferase n=1 Tax=Vibrio breoganii TaxID=553239 RepID=UPI000C82D710|nr:beta-1,6-N-acetylglucosaminyltransferase [Vibrio breoganii]PMO31950.1 hypothetical protein BCT12_17125 [Vibrio breoganii]
MKTNNKLAILILAHDNFSCIYEWSKFLQDEDIHFYLHVDKKVKLTPELNLMFSEINNFTLLNDTERVVVNWGGRSQVDAMLVLLKKAFKSEHNYSNFQFLSGHDYPIVDSVNLKAKLDPYSSNIRIDRVISKNSSKRITNLNLYDIAFLNPKNNSGIVSRLCKYLCSVVSLIPIQRMKEDFTFVHGSQWLALNKESAGLVLNFLDTNPWYYSYFKYSFGSDEIFIHSILYNSDSLVLEQEYIGVSEEEKSNNMLYGLHYIDWMAPNNTSGGPRLLSMNDLKSIIQYRDRGACFVRKINFKNKEFMTAIRLIGRSES